MIYKAVPGTTEELKAVAYLRGHKGRISNGAREIHMLGMKAFLDGLSQADRRRYHEILESVQLAESLRAGQELTE